MSFGAKDFERMMNAGSYHPYDDGARERSNSQPDRWPSNGPVTRSQTAEASCGPATIPSSIVSMHPFNAVGSSGGSNGSSLQVRLFDLSGSTEAKDGKAVGAPPPQPPPLVSLLTPSNPILGAPIAPMATFANAMAQQRGVMTSKEDTTAMDVDKETGGTDLSSVPAPDAKGLTPSSAATSAAFAQHKASTGLPKSE